MSVENLSAMGGNSSRFFLLYFLYRFNPTPFIYISYLFFCFKHYFDFLYFIFKCFFGLFDSFYYLRFLNNPFLFHIILFPRGFSCFVHRFVGFLPLFVVNLNPFIIYCCVIRKFSRGLSIIA